MSMKLLDPQRRWPVTPVARYFRVAGMTFVVTALLTVRVVSAELPGSLPGAAVTYEQPLAEAGAKVKQDPSTPLPAAPAEGAFSGSPLPLRGPDRTGDSSGAVKSSWGGPLVTMLGSLSFVLALFFAIAWFMKRQLPAGGWALPGDVLQVLGRAALTPRQNVHLVRLGNRLLLIAVSPAGAETLAEVTDADEIERLTSLCAPPTLRSPGSLFPSRWLRPAANPPEVRDG
ncbi:MAG: hypothetical protein GTN77_05455 [Planctomycetales bacterium]|nr:hypothetical protein [Planctomycetales bacterium]